MYAINDKSEAIRAIQRSLTLIDGERYYTVPNGRYDEKTRAVVTKFQEDNGLPTDGAVDYGTNTAIADAAMKKSETYSLLDTSSTKIPFPISLGYFGDEMTDIHRAISEILDYYGIYHSVKCEKYYSQETARAVAEIRRAMHLSYGEHIDEELYSRMLRERKSINIFKQIHIA